MMLKRKIEKDIMRWLEGSDKALLIYGVRQAGKTFIIRECLRAAGCNYIEFNLICQPDFGRSDGHRRPYFEAVSVQRQEDHPRQDLLFL